QLSPRCERHTLSLHAALPIWSAGHPEQGAGRGAVHPGGGDDPAAEPLARGDDPICEPELRDQRVDRAGGGRVRLRARVQGEVAGAREGELRDRAAEAVLGLEQHHAVPRALVASGGEQPREAAADDEDPGAHASGASAARATRWEWRKATRSVRTCGSVSGGTPWPRFTTCPAAAAPASSTPRASAKRASSEVNRTAGSMLPCTGVPAGRTSSARSRRRRWSTPIAVAPAPSIGSSRCAAPTPKWIRGTGRSETWASAAAEWACTCSRYCSCPSAPTQESNSCTAEAPARTWARRKRPDSSATQVARRSHRSGRERISARVRRWSRLGPPSTM